VHYYVLVAANSYILAPIADNNQAVLQQSEYCTLKFKLRFVDCKWF